MDSYFDSSQDPNCQPEDTLSEFLRIESEEDIKKNVESVLKDEISSISPSSSSPLLSNSNVETFDVSPKDQLTSEYDLKPKHDDEVCEQKTSTNKRKRKFEDKSPLYLLTEIFLRIFYPLSTCMTKNVVVGISKNFNFKPVVLLYSGTKSIVFDETSWESLNKYVHLIECYFLNNVYGKKTCINLTNSDIEVENSKIRGELLIKFRNISKHDVKILLSIDEFRMLSNIIPAVNRYIGQLTLSENMFRTYLIDTIEDHENSALLYGPLDTTIYNRLPQEVFLNRQMKSLARESQQNDDPNNPVCLLVENKYLNNNETVVNDDQV